MTGGPRSFAQLAHAHLAASRAVLDSCEREIHLVGRWGADAAQILVHGGRLLAAGNGGSAAHAQHLTSELVGRYRDDRLPLSAIALHSESSAVTAIVNDYGSDAMFARQVRAHGRCGDVLVLLSTSGASENLLRAAGAAADIGVRVWALTGRVPNPLAVVADEAIAIDGESTASVQEAHQVLIHLFCDAVDQAVRALTKVSAR